MSHDWDTPMNPFYFVIARDTGNVIRVIQRDSRPANTRTLIHRSASIWHRDRYADYFASGKNLVHASQVLNDFNSSELQT
ncbi:hypothetical protein [Pseudomonas alkylphenolica]|jgi:hypothetical protein|uniref:hypothetical protein n=1 Tax=Pseudomonas alkylphenolica TaxID=237609 RepID=UPI00315C7BD3